MKYEEFLQKKEFSKSELLACAWGTLVVDPPKKVLRPFLLLPC